jgi:hypothetical protein
LIRLQNISARLFSKLSMKQVINPAGFSVLVITAPAAFVGQIVIR